MVDALQYTTHTGLDIIRIRTAVVVLAIAFHDIVGLVLVVAAMAGDGVIVISSATLALAFLAQCIARR